MPALDLQQAISLLEEGNAGEAVGLLEEMVLEMPAYATARVLLARGYEALGQWGRALEIWREALHLVPNSPVIRRGLERAAARSLQRSRLDARPDADGRPPSPQSSSPAGSEFPAQPLPEEDESPYPEPEMPRLTQDTDLETTAPEEPYDAEEHADHFPFGEDISDDSATPGHEPHFEDLDRLINELESARIVPRPDIGEVSTPELEDDIEDVVSETLARIYASQGQYDEAARVYELLAGQHPEDSDEFLKKASEMRARASDES